LLLRIMYNILRYRDGFRWIPVTQAFSCFLMR
jgi:hypothetical protein